MEDQFLGLARNRNPWPLQPVNLSIWHCQHAQNKANGSPRYSETSVYQSISEKRIALPCWEITKEHWLWLRTLTSTSGRSISISVTTILETWQRRRDLVSRLYLRQIW